MRSFASADALGVLGWPGAQKKCLGLLGDCAAAAEVANANSKATTRCKPEIHLSEWVRICDLPCRDEESGLPASTALRLQPELSFHADTGLCEPGSALTRERSSSTTKCQRLRSVKLTPGSSTPTMFAGIDLQGMW